MSQIAREARELHGQLSLVEDTIWSHYVPGILDMIQRLDERLDRLDERIATILEVNDLWSGE